MSFRRRYGVFAVLAVSVAFVGGCGETVIDDVKTEDALEQNVERSLGKKVTAVDCPSGVEVEKGKTFDCVLTLAGGQKETATMKILNEDADIELADLKSAK
jgi:Domain of unknown function (DUF4333)